ncbi:Uncharacterized protein TCM_031688 [Theobroma cacao]|uniref:Reverse transcriptase Ty1/copia-type domain-containing protein n=1 Tax=Theobroma cacao TaxID=3641 RepID=A0A061F8I7_THECC|nr:Uncharacterized protein TCM_031688 [Theobroma cacao]
MPGGEPPATRHANPTIAQIKQLYEEVAKRYKTLSSLHSAISETVFARIMHTDRPKELWDLLRNEFQGSERTRQMQALNLQREFEMLRIKKEETIQEFSRKTHEVEESRDIPRLTLSEFINALEAQEQRKAFKEEDYTDSALVARTRNLKLDRSFKAKVEIGNGVFLEIVGTGTVAVEIDSGYKFCTIFDPKGDEVLTVKMKNKCYLIDWKHTKHKSIVSSAVDSELRHRRDIKFDEQSWWNWDKLVVESFGSSSQTSGDEQCKINSDEDIEAEHPTVRGTRSLQNIYARCNVVVVEPTCYYEATKDTRRLKAMEQEMQMIEKNGTWILVDKPANQHIIGVKWIYKTKINADVARLDTIRLISALAAQKGWKIFYLDVKSAFLNGYLPEDIYIQQLKGFIKPSIEGKACKLVKCIVWFEAGFKSLLRLLMVLTTVKGYSQIDGIDYCETFALVARLDTIRLISALATRKGWKIFYLDVKSAFLNGYLPEDIYIQQLEDDSRSTRGYYFSFGSAIFSWNSKKQEVMAQSSAEAEYISTAAVANQVIWIKKILGDLGFEQKTGTPLMIDNKSAIFIVKNPVHYRRTKHIKVKFHFIRDAVKDNEITVIYYGTNDQVADIFTKFIKSSKIMKQIQFFGAPAEDYRSLNGAGCLLLVGDPS